MRRMSFSATVPRCRDRTKTETRRTGWQWLAGELAAAKRRGEPLLLLAVSRVMGFKRGEPIDGQVEVFGTIEVLEVSREPLNAITPDAVAREGWPGMSPDDFVQRFLEINRGASLVPTDPITVIRFRWVTDARGRPV